MKRNILFVGIMALVAIVAFNRCENNYPPSVWNPDDPGKPTPVITAIVPADTSYEGVGIIDIYGHFFSANPAENLVFFNAGRGTVLEADTNHLKVNCPVLIESPTQNAIDSVKIKIAVQGAYLFGEYKKPDGTYRPYRLERAAIEYGAFDANNKPHALEVGPDEALYVATEAKNIYKVYYDNAGNLVTEPWASNLAISIITGMRMGKDGKLYFVRKNKSIYQIAQGGTKVEWAKNTATNGNLNDLDFDENGIIYAVGNGDSIFAFNSNVATPKSKGVFYSKGFDFCTARVYDGYLYVAGKYTGTNTQISPKAVWRFRITSTIGGLDTLEEVFDWNEYVGATGPAIQSFAIDENGDIYIGSKETYDATPAYVKTPAITVYHPATKVAEPWYDSILYPPATHMAWGNRNYLYVTRLLDNEGASGAPKIRVIRVSMPMNGAPYYGRP